MSKTTGLGWTTFNVDDGGGTARDIRNDCRSLDFETPRGVWDVTGLDKSAYERLLLLADFSCTPKGVFNDAASTGSHTVLKTVASSSVQRAVGIVVTGSAGTNTLSNECILTNYKVARSEEGELTFEAPFVLADGTVPTWS